MTQKYHRWMFRLTILAVAAISLVATGCDRLLGDEPDDSAAIGKAAEEAIAVKLEPVAKGALSSLYTTSANLRAEKKAMIIARTTGVIEAISVEEGDRVDEGQIVAMLEESEPRIESERATRILEIKERAHLRSTELKDEGMVSENDFDNSLRELVEARHASSMATLNLAHTKICAPFGGTILSRVLDQGATVSNGTEIFEIADLSPLLADVKIPERHVARLNVGQSVRLATIDGGQLVASIERIGPAVDPTNGTVKVTVSVSNQDQRLRPGAFTKIAIVTDTHRDAVIVPRNALVADGHRWHLFKADESQRRVTKIEVELGYEEGNRVEIASVFGDETLDVGHNVVVVGAAALTDGALIEVLEKDTDAQSRTPNDTVGQLEHRMAERRVGSS